MACPPPPLRITEQWPAPPPPPSVSLSNAPPPPPATTGPPKRRGPCRPRATPSRSGGRGQAFTAPGTDEARKPARKRKSAGGTDRPRPRPSLRRLVRRTFWGSNRQRLAARHRTSAKGRCRRTMTRRKAPALRPAPRWGRGSAGDGVLRAGLALSNAGRVGLMASFSLSTDGAQGRPQWRGHGRRLGGDGPVTDGGWGLTGLLPTAVGG